MHVRGDLVVITRSSARIHTPQIMCILLRYHLLLRYGGGVHVLVSRFFSLPPTPIFFSLPPTPIYMYTHLLPPHVG